MKFSKTPSSHSSTSRYFFLATPRISGTRAHMSALILRIFALEGKICAYDGKSPLVISAPGLKETRARLARSDERVKTILTATVHETLACSPLPPRSRRPVRQRQRISQVLI